MTSPDSSDVPVLEAHNLSFCYASKPVLSGLDFALWPGEFNALLGPNGAGKSTLFGLTTRLLALQQGTLKLNGRSLRDQPSAVMGFLGVVFQQSALDMDLSVDQNLRYHAALHGMSPRQARLACARELERLQLEGCAKVAIRQLNGGHRRRVEIARALLHEPRFLLLDEPSVGLDVESRRDLNRHVRSLCAERALTVLWATHLIEEIHSDDRVLVLDRGHLIADDKADALCQAHAQPSLAATFDVLIKEHHP